MAEKYYAILTSAGKDLEAQAIATGVPVKLVKFVVGDGNGQEITPDPARTTLVKERYRGDISDLLVSPDQSSQMIAQLSVPADVGNFTIRELGLITDGGVLYSVASSPAIEKPVGGVGVNLSYRLAVSGTDNVTLEVATGDGLFLRQDANLSDVKDKATSRNNLDLGNLATKDVDYIYPVGIVTWFAQNKNPNTLFPGTAWSYIGENKTIRLAKQNGTDVLKTGGADTVKLTTANLPAHGHAFSANTSSFNHGDKATSSAGSHNHSVSGTAASAGSHTHRYRIDHVEGNLNVASGGGSGGMGTTEAAGDHTHSVSGTAATAGAHTHTVSIGSHSHSVSGTTGNTGSGTDISITNAFVTLMGWYRTA